MVSRLAFEIVVLITQFSTKRFSLSRPLNIQNVFRLLVIEKGGMTSNVVCRYFDPPLPIATTKWSQESFLLLSVGELQCDTFCSLNVENKTDLQRNLSIYIENSILLHEYKHLLYDRFIYSVFSD